MESDNKDRIDNEERKEVKSLSRVEQLRPHGL